MTIQLIPTGQDPYRQQVTTLEGTSYLLSFSYNQRCACWYLSVADASGVDIYNGVKLICNNALLRKCADPRKPPGEFMVMSATSDISPPGLADLLPGSGRCSLYYVTSDWLALMAAGQVQQLLDLLRSNTQNATASTYGAK